MEILFALSLVTIIGYLIIPNWQWYQHKHQADVAIDSLHQALSTAQMLAISQQRTMSACPSVDGQHCHTQWQGQLLIFADSSSTSYLVARLPLVVTHGSVQWRHFNKRSKLMFDDTGRLQNDNGTWLYCSAIADPAFNRALSINSVGRLRRLTHRNSQGQLVDSHGQALLCHP